MAQSTFDFAAAPDKRPQPTIDPAPGAYAELAVEAPLRRTFVYHIPAALRPRVRPGSRLRVPFAHQTKTAYYLRVAPAREVRALAAEGVALRDATELLDEAPLLDDSLLALARWMAEHYRCALGEALAAMVPAGVKRRQRAERIAFVRLAVSVEEAVAAARDLAEHAKHRSPKQAQLLSALVVLGGRARVREALSAAGAGRQQLQALERKGLVHVRQAEVDPLDLYQTGSAPQPPPEPTPHQARALARIGADLRLRRHAEHLLQGVTGSGKTEVYLRAIESVVARGQAAIVLVPEISLTPQTAERFGERFDRVALLHSHLTEGQRADAWRRIAAGDAQVVIGARSAVFAPVPDLGLIVVDEEHETSYKQEKAPRYNARDVARARARLANAVLILGSATPSLESAARVERGEATRQEMPVRVAGRPMPPVEIVDMRDECRRAIKLLSRRLIAGLRETLAAGEQAILFLNRRGHATFIHCPRCGHVEKCSTCDVVMTHHRKDAVILCHYCGREQSPPAACPACGKPDILYHGAGTEKIEAVVGRVFPAARIARMDSDTMRDRTAYARLLGAFRRGEIDILVGTQMIAKGLDFPNVTLVGIIKADLALHFADFRASERTFQLIAQVAGRTGRSSKGGRVIVQTFAPENEAIQAAATHDFPRFARQELQHRREWNYPPYVQMARIIVQGPDLAAVKKRAGEIHAALTAAWGEPAGSEHAPAALLPFPPAPCPVAIIKGEYRFHLLCRAATSALLTERLDATAELDRAVTGVQVVVDVDPVNMM